MLSLGLVDHSYARHTNPASISLLPLWYNNSRRPSTLGGSSATAPCARSWRTRDHQADAFKLLTDPAKLASYSRMPTSESLLLRPPRARLRAEHPEIGGAFVSVPLNALDDIDLLDSR